MKKQDRLSTILANSQSSDHVLISPELLFQLLRRADGTKIQSFFNTKNICLTNRREIPHQEHTGICNHNLAKDVKSCYRQLRVLCYLSRRLNLEYRPKYQWWKSFAGEALDYNEEDFKTIKTETPIPPPVPILSSNSKEEEEGPIPLMYSNEELSNQEKVEQVAQIVKFLRSDESLVNENENKNPIQPHNLILEEYDEKKVRSIEQST